MGWVWAGAVIPVLFVLLICSSLLHLCRTIRLWFQVRCLYVICMCSVFPTGSLVRDAAYAVCMHLRCVCQVYERFLHCLVKLGFGKMRNPSPEALRIA